MLCPICGKELPEKARKCDKCGCRPKYLYGRPKLPKWVAPAAVIALVAAILVGSLVFWLTREETYEVSLLSSSKDIVGYTQYYYDDKGNLEKVTYRPTLLSSSSLSSSAILIPSLEAQFYYDESGVFTKTEMLWGERNLTGKVEYDDAAGTVTVRLKAEDSLSAGPYLFRYGPDGQLQEYTSGTADQHKINLKYDEAGRLISETSVYRYSGSDWKSHREDTLKYDEEGKLTSFYRRYSSSGYGYTYYCGTDQWGNVVEVDGMEWSYQYLDRQVVTATMLRQYELQLRLLNMMGVSQDMVVLPIMKTPC